MKPAVPVPTDDVDEDVTIRREDLVDAVPPYADDDLPALVRETVAADGPLGPRLDDTDEDDDLDGLAGPDDHEAPDTFGVADDDIPTERNLRPVPMEVEVVDARARAEAAAASFRSELGQLVVPTAAVQEAGEPVVDAGDGSPSVVEQEPAMEAVPSPAAGTDEPRTA